MQQRDSDQTQQSTMSRRPFLAATSASVAGLAGLAGCLGDDDAPPLTDSGPGETGVDSGGVRWDDLGDLEGEISIYCGRDRDQIDDVFEALEDEYDDLTVRVGYDDNDVHVNQIIEEGDATAADLMYSQDPGALGELEREGVVQALPDDIVEGVPESYRDPDGYWTGVTGRVRAIQYNSDRLDETEFDGPEDFPDDIMEFATDERFQGIISTRPNSGTFRGFIQAMVELEGEEATREWVSDMMEDQDAQLFTSGGDQAAAVEQGGDDDPIIALGNSYYAARLISEDPDSPVDVAFTENDAGCLFSVAGVAATNAVSDPDMVAEFIRHLIAEEGQELMMEQNGEYPVVEDIDYVDELPDLDEINPPEFDLSDFDMDMQGARDIIEDEGMEV
ncbi:iron(III) transport system substrate-binding protein [Natronorubrum sediminis]|uniref:Iron(III) transport system substrate-binding protein n=1 Tax=Natronorubrum sediminis TaxID=640943 RepID=A0A1H6G4N4_9EURY|nr:extracellular solute-binding protein [Natronorubrum sediminis]SEH17580.1 iron(III) transport system substrate-binding protein [Natronorubrum sediminis]